MSPLQLALWGLLGGFAVEGLELAAAIRRTRGWPWRKGGEVGLGPYLASVVIRLMISSALATAFGMDGQVNGATGALMVGITAPLIVEKMSRYIATAQRAPATTTEAEPIRSDAAASPAMTTITSAGARLETGDA
jgi:hypothetical protein